ncbi:uncharacterized protein LOC123721148 [Papilio machaon]|uniref:uncharacterized protein LOC123721148 n=1 Tax=Papilio machaon TaxID=76193 RepID=UPI001E663E00|nr:uncharacterized protein LOC123721148 [Papilio machaon]
MMVEGTNNICKFTTFNCKNFKSSIDDIRKLCNCSNLICLQETWLFNHDIPLLGTVSPDFEYTGKSAIDSGELLIGRPYGGVAILWRKGVFNNVSVIECSSSRLIAINASVDGRSVLVFSVYMPTKSRHNLPIFTEVLSEINAIVESNNTQTVFILGDMNAHPGQLFYSELSSFCGERSWLCADVEFLGFDSSSFTFYDTYHGTGSWLDHCVVSQAAWQTVVNVGIVEDIFVSDHLPIFLESKLGDIKPVIATPDVPRSAIRWGERDKRQIARFQILCNEGLRSVDFPEDFTKCAYGSCNLYEHTIVLDKMYTKLICHILK